MVKIWTKTWNGANNIYENVFKGQPLDNTLAGAEYKKNGSLSYWDEYYSGSDVGVFIGSIWVDDIITIQYTETNNKSPMYGYMSKEFDAVAGGTKIIQGQFAVAFKKVGYLTDILTKYNEEFGTFDARNIGTYDWKRYYEIKEKFIKGLKAGKKELSKEDKEFYDFGGGADEYGVEHTNHGDYIRREGFDVIVTFGDSFEIGRGGTVEVINGVHVTSKSIVCEPTGEPIAEMYSFFARSLNKFKPSFQFFPEYEKSNLDEVASDINIQENAFEAKTPQDTVPENVDNTELVKKVSDDYNIG